MAIKFKDKEIQILRHKKRLGKYRITDLFSKGFLDENGNEVEVTPLGEPAVIRVRSAQIHGFGHPLEKFRKKLPERVRQIIGSERMANILRNVERIGIVVGNPDNSYHTDTMVDYFYPIQLYEIL